MKVGSQRTSNHGPYKRKILEKWISTNCGFIENLIVQQVLRKRRLYAQN
jgi:hypothetical protein